MQREQQADEPQTQDVIEQTALKNLAKNTAEPAYLAPRIPTWQTVPESSVPTDFRRPTIDNVAYLEVGGMDGLVAGDTLTIVIPQENKTYTVSISDASVSQSGNRSLAGFLEGQAIYRFLITVGSKQTFATLNTPGGQYQMEARDGIGRLIPTAAIKAKLDYTKPDYVIPERFKEVDTVNEINKG
jgi:hypothetical protein